MQWFDKFFSLSLFVRFSRESLREKKFPSQSFASFLILNPAIAGCKEHRSKLRELEDARLKLELSRLYCQGRRFRGRTIPFHSWEHSQLTVLSYGHSSRTLLRSKDRLGATFNLSRWNDVPRTSRIFCFKIAIFPQF